VLLAQAEKIPAGGWKSPVFLTTLILIGVLLLGAMVIAVVDRWRKRSRQDRPDTGDQLSHFRSLYDRGELTPEEFERIRSKLGAKLRQELNVPGKGEAKPDVSAATATPAGPEKPADEKPQPPEPPA